MRRLFMNLVLILGVFVLLTACSKKDDNPTESESNPAGGKMTAKINGTDWSAKTSVVGVYTNNILTVTGQNNPGGTSSEQMQIVITNITKTGEYTLSIFGNTGRFTVATSPTDITTYLTMDQVAGTVNVTSLDSKGAKGTFSFTAKNSNDQNDVKEITNGSFEVTF